MPPKRKATEPDGFRPEPDEFKVAYDEPKMRGLIAYFDDLSVGEALEIDVLRFGTSSTFEERRDRLTALYEAIASHLVSWNLLHPKTGEPVPATAAGLLSMNQTFAGNVITGYIDAIRGVAAPLDDSSTSGEPFPEGSIPMEAL